MRTGRSEGEIDLKLCFNGGGGQKEGNMRELREKEGLGTGDRGTEREKEQTGGKEKLFKIYAILVSLSLY